MGETSKRLHGKLKKKASSLNLPTGKMRGRADMPSIEAWIREGMDPVHAAYAFVQHITSAFAEGVSQLPEMKAYARIVGAAEEEYMPSGPPMSPLTASFFTTWAFYDLRFDGTDTLASCLMEANDVVCMNPDQLDALKKLADSRMGVYEQVGTDGPHVRLRELVTGDDYTCHSASGYRGRSGELWYVRLLPPLLPDLARYHVAFTTPYVLMAGKADWTQFLQRSLMPSRSGDERQALYRLLKYGSGPNYWNEFVFKAYYHHQPDAIFLAGIPDLEATLPHA
jgi:hypothetical protein